MSADEQKKREYEIKAERVKRYRERMTKTGDQINYILGWTNHLLPIGWMPLGISRAAAGDLLPAAWGFLGMSAITFLSLRRSYRTTLRYFSRADWRGAPVAIRRTPSQAGSIGLETCLNVT